MQPIKIPPKPRSLSPNERMVLKMLSDGKTKHDIAHILGLPVQYRDPLGERSEYSVDRSVEGIISDIRDKGYKIPKFGEDT